MRVAQPPRPACLGYNRNVRAWVLTPFPITVAGQSSCLHTLSPPTSVGTLCCPRSIRPSSHPCSSWGCRWGFWVNIPGQGCAAPGSLKARPLQSHAGAQHASHCSQQVVLRGAPRHTPPGGDESDAGLKLPSNPLRPYWEYLSFLFRKGEIAAEQQPAELAYRDFLQVGGMHMVCRAQPRGCAPPMSSTHAHESPLLPRNLLRVCRLAGPWWHSTTQNVSSLHCFLAAVSTAAAAGQPGEPDV